MTDQREWLSIIFGFMEAGREMANRTGCSWMVEAGERGVVCRLRLGDNYVSRMETKQDMLYLRYPDDCIRSTWEELARRLLRHEEGGST